MNQLIYLADDEANIRQLIKGFLEKEGYDVVTFDTGDALHKKFLEHPSDLVILDIMMPGTDGLSICSEIRRISQVPIIIVSAKGSELDRVTGITLGSDDYLVKPFSPLELVARIKGIFRRMSFEKTTATNQLNFADVTLDLDTRTCHFLDVTIDLTPTEYELMVYMFKNSNRAVSRKELLEHVWSYKFDADTRAVDDTLKRLRKKITATDVKIVAVWGFGFKLEKKSTA